MRPRLLSERAEVGAHLAQSEHEGRYTSDSRTVSGYCGLCTHCEQSAGPDDPGGCRHCNDRHSTTMQSQDIAATGFPCGHRPSRGANFRQQKRRMTPMRSGGSFVTGNPSAARSSLKSIICLAPHAPQTVGRHPLQRQAFDNDAVAGHCSHRLPMRSQAI